MLPSVRVATYFPVGDLRHLSYSKYCRESHAIDEEFQHLQWRHHGAWGLDVVVTWMKMASQPLVVVLMSGLIEIKSNKRWCRSRWQPKLKVVRNEFDRAGATVD